MEIRGTDGLGGVGGPGRVDGPRSQPPAPAAGGVGRGAEADRVEISNVARLLGAANQLPPVRQDKVDQVKADIAAGRFETPQRIDRMLEKLLDDLG